MDVQNRRCPTSIYIDSFQIVFRFQPSNPSDKFSARNITHPLPGRLDGQMDGRTKVEIPKTPKTYSKAPKSVLAHVCFHTFRADLCRTDKAKTPSPSSFVGWVTKTDRIHIVTKIFTFIECGAELIRYFELQK